MIELVIVYCLSADTKTCTEKRLRMENFTSPMGCTMSAQQRAQEYLRDHPSYVLKSWRCEVNMPRQTSIDPDRAAGLYSGYDQGRMEVWQLRPSKSTA